MGKSEHKEKKSKSDKKDKKIKKEKKHKKDSVEDSDSEIEAEPVQKQVKLSDGGVAHPFETDYNDHFETPREAYEHIVPLLDGIAQTLYGSNSRDKLTIYDPFYCNGAVVTHLNALGFTKVVHENRDFYADK